MPLDEVASCGDEVRGGSFRCAGAIPMKKGETGDWHFINIPIGSSPTAGTLLDSCRNSKGKGSCIVEQIPKQIGVLENKKASREARQLALIWLTHLVGDLHQPLHCSTEYSRKDRHDYGGGKKMVRLADAKGAEGMNLHRLWDGVLRPTAEERGPGAKVLAGQLSEELAGKDTAAWVEGDLVAQAALESFKIADETIYPEYRKEKGRIKKSYRDRMRPVAYERLQKAGVRLAYLIEETLK